MAFYTSFYQVTVRRHFYQFCVNWFIFDNDTQRIKIKNKVARYFLTHDVGYITRSIKVTLTRPRQISRCKQTTVGLTVDGRPPTL